MNLPREILDLPLEDKRKLARKLLRAGARHTAPAGGVSRGQQAMWFLHQLAPDSPAYHFLFAALVKAEVDVDALRRACQWLLDRHDALRTSFRTDCEGRLEPLVRTFPAQVDVIDASLWTDEQLQAWLEHEADRPFDLRSGPVLRVSLLRRGPARHVLALVAHHIAADLWSMDVLVHELQALYEAETGGRSTAPPEPTARYADFVRYEQELLAGPRGEALWRYWRDRLAGCTPLLDLPTDRPRPAVQTYRGDARSWTLAAETTDRLRDVARQHKTTLFTTVLAAFEVLLHRYTNQDDVLVGTTVATRGRPEWERLVGYLLNQVVLRGDLSGKPSFSTFLDRVRQDVLGALEHQEFPFPALVERLQPQRDAGRTPLFQVMFIWDKPGEPSLDSNRLPLEPLAMEQRGAPFDLTLIVFEVGGRLTLSFRYNTDLFDGATIEQMASAFDTLLTAIAADCRQPISQLPLLTAAEQDRLTNDRIATSAPLGAEICIHHLFERQVDQRPDATALVCGRQELTYAELERRANLLANLLIRSGAEPGSLVALCLPRSIDMVASVLAVWKAGASYVPLDPAYPPARLELMLADARPAVVVATESTRALVAASGVQVLCLDHQEAVLSSLPEERPLTTVGPDDLAYCIFTSGSTGRPKGVLVSHRGVSNLAQAQRAAFGVGPEDRVFQFASLSFDASVFELTMALAHGAALVVGDGPAMHPGPSLVALLNDHRVTNITLPPSALAMLKPEELPSLRTVITAGEACPAAIVAAWAPGRRFFNAYGPTETTVWATVAECRPDERPPSIGHPIANTFVYVLDDHLQPTPLGVPGELYVGGVGVAKGYLNQPALTAERFLPNPFCHEHGGTIYRTGDHVRWRADGTLEFLGRADQQVKIRGYRIELGEVEAALGQLAGVRQAAVAVRHDAGHSPRLVGYVVTDEPAVVASDALRSALKTRLPEFMVPSVIVALKQMPLTSNGKIDRRALPAPDVARPELSVSYVAPRTETERQLAAVWSRVLGVDKVGIRDNFFDLGGASLETLRASELAAAAGLHLTPEQLFQFQTIEELAAACQEVPAEAAGSLGPPTTNGTVPQQHQPAANSAPAIAPTDDTASGNAVAAAGMLIESLGVYLPARVVTTEEVVRGCRKSMAFPLERMTGIRARRMVSDGEYSIDLARRAVEDCLSRSRCDASHVDLLICANISRCDGPDWSFTYEPTTALRLKREFGFEHALAFDISNACAGFFTALAISRALLQSGDIDRALVVSGEHITHLTQVAQREISSFMDPRMACLTLGDSGLAAILERAPRDNVGFRELDMFTLGRYSSLCIAKATSQPHGGAIMLTDPVKSTAVTVGQSVRHAMATLRRHGWNEQTVHHVVLHQTSETTLEGAIQELNRAFGKDVCSRRNTVFNVAERGNTATTSQFVAIMDRIRAGDVGTGDNVVFGITGSGQTIGTALYTFDDLPERIRNNQRPARLPPRRMAPRPRKQAGPRMRIESCGLARPSRPDAAPESLALLRQAGEACLSAAPIRRDQIDLILHSGVYRSEFLSEPAIAAIMAGELKINDDTGLEGRRSFAFDVLNGGVGALNACHLANQFARSGKYRTALVLASEIENNTEVWPEHLVGIEPAGSALLLRTDEDGVSGFAGYVFRSFAEHSEALRTHTVMRAGQTALSIRRDPRLEALYLEHIPDVVGELLDSQQTRLEDVQWVIPPQISGGFVRAAARALAVPVQRVVDATNGHRNLFTSSLAFGWQVLHSAGRARPGDRVLFISAGAGIEIGCALYVL